MPKDYEVFQPMTNLTWDCPKCGRRCSVAFLDCAECGTEYRPPAGATRAAERGCDPTTATTVLCQFRYVGCTTTADVSIAAPDPRDNVYACWSCERNHYRADDGLPGSVW